MNIFEPTDQQKLEWEKWVKNKPSKIREIIADKFLPWKLYMLKTTHQRVTLYSIDESRDAPVTLTVCVSGRYNLVAFERMVFGIKPEDLEECDLPNNEIVGSVLYLG